MKRTEVMELDDIEVLELLNSPTRIRILRHLVEPAPIKEVADRLDVPVTRLYYHVNLLEQAGLLEVVETNKVGSMTQRVYQTTATNFRPARGVARDGRDPAEMARIASGVVLDGARVDAEEALTRHFSDPGQGESDWPGVFGRTIALFTKKQAEEFGEKLSRFMEEEFDPDDRDEGDEYALTVAFFPLAGGDRGGDIDG